MKNENNKFMPFSNNFGAISIDEINIDDNEKKISLSTKIITQIYLVKKRKIELNIFFLFLFLSIFWMKAYNNIFLIDKDILGVSGITFLLLSIFYYRFESEMLILLKFDFIKIKVKNCLKEDAKKIITQFYNNN
jgi:hypothetical protein